jgi:tRNA-specific 2-thiouridylase
MSNLNKLGAGNASFEKKGNKEVLVKKTRVAVGLSGGVDSSVSAALLVEQGYEVTGVYIEGYPLDYARGLRHGCRAEQDRKDALDVALKLGIPFKVLDMRKEYKEKVLEYFFKEYEAGRTPNPDTVCNREIKFGLFYDWALRQGFDYVATGHYARIRKDESLNHCINEPGAKAVSQTNQHYILQRSVDAKKDQSYFLYLLRPEQLEHILFPIGAMSKLRVRREANLRGLNVANKPDSQGICFVGEVNVKDFLKARIKPVPGKVIDIEINEEIGVHDGAWFYTIGQRGGWKFTNSELQKIFEGSMPIYYVVKKNIKKNILYVGQKNYLYKNSFVVSEVNDLIKNFSLMQVGDLAVRIRHGGKLYPCKVEKKGNKYKVTTDELVWGVAAGQAAVFYDSNTDDAVVLGGGVILE